MIAKAVCMDHELMEIVFLEGIKTDVKPFLNVILTAPRKDGAEVTQVHKTDTQYPFIKELMVKWDQRFPSISTYMLYPSRGWKLIDIDIEDTTYCNEEELERFRHLILMMNECNRVKATLKRDRLKTLFGYMRDIGDNIMDQLSPMLEIDENRLFFTGRGFSMWAKYDDDRVKEMMNSGMICDSNDPHRKAQRLCSPLFLRMNKESKGHMQTCVPYNDWERFKFSNPAFFKMKKPQLRKMAMAYQDSLLVSRNRTGNQDYEEWFDVMQKKQVSIENEIIESLKLDIEPIVT